MEQEQSGENRNRRYYSAEEKDLVIKLYEESGLSVNAFSEREGIEGKSLRRWLARREEAKTPKPRLVEVETPAPVSSREGHYRMGFESGGWLEFGGGFDAAEVHQLVEMLRC